MLRTALLLLLLLPVHAAAQWIDDPGGDHAPVSAYEDVDLVALDATVDGTLVTLALQTGGLAAPAEVVYVDSTYYEIHFRFERAAYVLEVYRRVHAQSNVDGVALDASLDRVHGDRTVPTDIPLVMEEDTAAGVLRATFDAALLRDHLDLHLLPGDVLNSPWAVSYGQLDTIPTFISNPPQRPTPHDRMPDDGAGREPLTIPADPDGTGLHLRIPDPVRSSNGGPTTLVYPIDVRNTAEERDVELALEGLPDHWRARVVPDRLQLAPGDNATVHVVVETVGAHGHGGDTAFALVADGHRLDLAVHYPEVPQPADHHDTVWFHSASLYADDPVFAHYEDAFRAAGLPFATLWMNTLEEDDADERLARGPYRMGGDNVWRHPLAPSLATGLRMDVNSTGEVVVPLTASHGELSGVVVSARLVFAAPGRTTYLAVTPPSAPLDLTAGETTIVTLALEPVADGARHRHDAELYLDVVLEQAPPSETTAFGIISPLMEGGGHARLPLLEYRDPLPARVQEALRAEGVLAENGTLQVEGPAPLADRDSPGLPAAPAIALLAALALAARRRGA